MELGNDDQVENDVDGELDGADNKWNIGLVQRAG
jgi:hypothetical protein